MFILHYIRMLWFIIHKHGCIVHVRLLCVMSCVSSSYKRFCKTTLHIFVVTCLVLS